MKISIIGNFDKTYVDLIKQQGNYEVELHKQGDESIYDSEILVGLGFNNEYTAPGIMNSKKLKWIHILAAGVETLPFNEIKQKNIIVTNSTGIHGIPISEHVFGMILNFTRNLFMFQQQKKQKIWKQQIGTELYGKTMGIIGLGSIGCEIARKAKAFDMKVIGIKNNKVPLENVDCVYGSEGLQEVLSQSDFVVIALPSTPQTKKLISKKQFESMKVGAYFVNISRGQIVDEASLTSALKNGKLKAACLDVFEEEPLPTNSELWDMENVIISPHLAALSPAYFDRAFKLFLYNLKQFEKNKELKNIVDLDKEY